MNKSQFMRAADISEELAEQWFSPLSKAMKEFGIVMPAAQAMFIAQIGHESNGFSRTRENLNYSPAGLKLTFGKYFSEQLAQQLGRTTEHPANQLAIANIVYANRMGNTEAGDGWKYRGRGLIQITGHDNYQLCSKALQIDLLLVPDLLEEDDYAARSAAWFYTANGCLKYSDDVIKVTRIINGGSHGLADRQARYETARAVLV